MTVLCERIAAPSAPAPDEAVGRRDLRVQIAKLEARGATTPALASGPRILSLGELETLRDALIASSGQLGPVPGPNRPLDAGNVGAGVQDHARRRLEAMFADPVAHRRASVSLAELGRPGCGTYRVRPRLGLVGMLAGWWEITLSSGCP